ncbi:MAG: DNA primase, partial [Micromonosporaceae bacterium]|nr:DNA primase [Micromonosporaceae bacterium]
YVRSGAEHDMSQLSTWPDLVARISAEDVVPLPEDRYELDLVVENLRGGQQAWDPDLVIRAGEVARDLGYALQLEQVQASLAPGSPLDDLDEAMRAAAGGGIGGFMARRRLKKIGAEAAPLGWRTIIGKISAAVDWRD